MSVLDSLDAMLASVADHGPMLRCMHLFVPSTTTAATEQCGGITAARYTSAWTMPSVGSGLAGAYFPNIRLAANQSIASVIAGLEYSLGTLTVSGNSFADGVAMPSKRSNGGLTPVQTVASEILVVVTATLTATTPVLTITYTDQDGNTGQTATLTLPTNAAIHSAFRVNPHLASGDTGIRDVTNLSISTGSAGSLVVYGILPLAILTMTATGAAGSNSPLIAPAVLYLVEPGDVIGFYRYVDATVASSAFVMLSGVAETS